MRIEVDDAGLVGLYKELRQLEARRGLSLAQEWLLWDVEARITDGDVDDYLRRIVILDKDRTAVLRRGEDG